MRVEGSCHCGRIRFEAEVDPATVVVCHCTDCQLLSGSAFRVVVPAFQGSFRLNSGEPRIYIKVADSGNEREQAFCADCGTPLYAAAPGTGPRVFALRVGALRQRDMLVPARQVWCRSEQKWLERLQEIEKIDGQRAFDQPPDGGR